MDIDGITAQLMAVQNFNKVIVNAIDNSDVKIFCIALYRALAQESILHTGLRRPL